MPALSAGQKAARTRSRRTTARKAVDKRSLTRALGLLAELTEIIEGKKAKVHAKQQATRRANKQH